MADDVDPGGSAGPDDSAGQVSPDTEAAAATEAAGESAADPSSGGEPTEAEEAAAAGGPDDEVAVTETVYEATPSGHRVTRRTIRERTSTTKKRVEVTVTEDIPLAAYQAPRAPHPAPVG